jgi:hypothetical protein
MSIDSERRFASSPLRLGPQICAGADRAISRADQIDRRTAPDAESTVARGQSMG